MRHSLNTRRGDLLRRFQEFGMFAQVQDARHHGAECLPVENGNPADRGMWTGRIPLVFLASQRQNEPWTCRPSPR